MVLWGTAAFASAPTLSITQGVVSGADGVEIHYREAGPRDALRSLLLIPGWRVSSLIWSQQLRFFGGLGDRVVAIDSRSQAGSSIVYAHNSPEDRAADIHAIIRNLQLTHVTLVGWSQGAQDVAAYVNRIGTVEVDDLVLVDAPVSAGPADVTGNPGFIENVLQGISLYSQDPMEYSKGMMHAIISAPISSVTLRTLVGQSLKTPVDVGISMLIQDLFAVDRRPYLKKFAKPTLVIASSRSPLLKVQQRMAASLPKGKFVLIRNAAHALFFDRPAAFDSAVEAFIMGRSRAEKTGRAAA